MIRYATLLFLSVALALLFVGATAVQAQEMNMTPSNLIDGRIRASEIPITLALRFWLNSQTHGAITVPQEIGLSQADKAVLVPIMAAHRGQLDGLARNYKSSGDRDTFWSAYNERTASDWNEIQVNLSHEGIILFMGYLEAQKAMMQVSAYDTGLGAVATRNLKEAQMVASMSGMAPQSGGMTPNYSSYNGINPYFASNGYDDFGAGSALDSDWTTTLGSFSISNGNVSVHTGGGANGEAVAYWSNGSFSSWEQCSYTSVGTVTGTNGVGPAINISATAQTYYAAVVSQASGIRIFKALNGAPVAIATYSHTPVSGEGYNMCNDGAGHITVTLNGNATPILSVTDTAIQSGYPGIRGDLYGAQSTLTMTSFAGGTLTTSIGINANVTGDTICGSGGFCTGKIHTPTVKNYNALRGSTVVGPGVSPDTYIDTYNNVIYPAVDFRGATDYIVYVSEEVDCSSFGVFFTAGPPSDPQPFWEQKELAIATFQMISPLGTPEAYWVWHNWCSTRTSPPDINAFIGIIVNDPQGEWKPASFARGKAYREGGFGIKTPWFALTKNYVLNTLPPTKPDCSMWDNGYPGMILKNTGGPQPRVPPLP